jgi:hypothetical protein
MIKLQSYKIFDRTVIAAFAGIALALLSPPTQLEAGAKAFSSLEISNFALYTATPDGTGGFSKGAAINVTDLMIFSSAAAPTTSAILDNVQSAALPSSQLLKCVGINCGGFGENDFTMTTPEGSAGNFSRADIDNSGAIIDDLQNGSAATEKHVAEVQLVSTAVNSNQARSSFTRDYFFSLDSSQNIWIEFDASWLTIASLNLDTIEGPSKAEARANFGISLFDFQDSNNPLFTFSPIDDTAEAFIPGSEDSADGFGHATTVTPFLSMNTPYVLHTRSSVTALALKEVAESPTVPEPATTTLFGLLGGIAAIRRRLNKQQ